MGGNERLFQTISGLIDENLKVRNMVQMKLKLDGRDRFEISREDLEAIKLQLVALEAVARTMCEREFIVSGDQKTPVVGKPTLRIVRDND